MAVAFTVRRALLAMLASALAPSVVAGQDSSRDTGDSTALGLAVSRIIRLTLESDPSVRAARARERAFQLRAAGAGLAPPLTGSVSVSDGPGGDVARGNASLELSRNLLLGSRQQAARASATTELALASRERRVAETAHAVRVTDLVVHGAAAARMLQRLRQSERLLAEAEDALAVRLAAGRGRYADILRVRTERLMVGFAIRDELAALSGVRGQFLAMHSEAPGLDSLDEWITDAAVGIGTVSGWRAVLDALPPMDSLVAMNAGVRDAEAARQRTRAMAAENAAARHANFSAAVGLQRIGPANGGPSVGLLLGVASTLPFSARRANSRATDADGAEIVAADAAAAAVITRARPTLENLRERQLVALSRLVAIDGAALLAADAEREAALAEFRAGALTLLELLDLERAFLRLELERTEALREAAGLRAALFGVEPHESGVRP